MAAVLRFISQGAPNNIASGSWNWGDVANGVRDGLLYTAPMLAGRQILVNNKTIPPVVRYVLSYLRSSVLWHLAPTVIGTLLCSLSLQFLKNRIIETLTLDTFMKKLPATIASFFLTIPIGKFALNRLSNERLPLDEEKISLLYLYRKMPYLIFLTNLALTALELKNNRMRSIVALAVSVSSLLTYANILPRKVAWYLNPALRMPMDLVAIYYGNNKDRFWIVAGWALVSEVQSVLMKAISKH